MLHTCTRYIQNDATHRMHRGLVGGGQHRLTQEGHIQMSPPRCLRAHAVVNPEEWEMATAATTTTTAGKSRMGRPKGPGEMLPRRRHLSRRRRRQIPNYRLQLLVAIACKHGAERDRWGFLTILSRIPCAYLFRPWFT